MKHLTLIFLLWGWPAFSQHTALPADSVVRPLPNPNESSPEDKSFPVFLIGNNYGINTLSNLRPSYEEPYIFEAAPILRMPFYNNIQDRFLDHSNCRASSTYFSFRPQLRMFKTNSKPVRTPSYKIGLGHQHIFRVKDESASPGTTRGYGGFSFETGHFSNGQAGAAFSDLYADGSPESDSLYRLITPQTDLSRILNRYSGNFSTNYTEIILKYCFIFRQDSDNYITRSLALETGYTRYHNNLLYLFDIGGFTENDIRIYGRNFFTLNIEFMNALQVPCLSFLDRYELRVGSEYIRKPHPWVNPFRLEISASVFTRQDLGIFISYAAGHDNYNYRFVDNIQHLRIGIQYDVSSRIKFN